VVEHYIKTVTEKNVIVLADDVGHYPQLEDTQNVVKFYLEFVLPLVTKNHLGHL
jgi:hypothetical protein